MGIDVTAAHIQSGQLKQYVYWLESAKNMMVNYKNQLNNNWFGSEVILINQSIDQVISSLDHNIDELKHISDDVINAANEIRREEIEAQRRQQMNEAKKNMETTGNEIARLSRQQDDLKRMLNNQDNPDIRKQYQQMDIQIQSLRRQYNSWVQKYNALQR